MKLQGKVAFITGAASGFGKEFTLHLLRNNCRVGVFFSEGYLKPSRAFMMDLYCENSE